MAEVPEVIRVMRAFRDGLLRREAAQVRTMTQRWLGVEDRLRGQIDTLARELAAARAAGRVLTAAQVGRLASYRRLQTQIRAELTRYTAYAAQTVAAGQAELAAQGFEAGAAALRAVAPDLAPSVFRRLDRTAVEAMVGLAGDGTPLATLLAQSYGEAAAAVAERLVAAVALGWHPNRTAAEIARAARVGLNRALVLARTEQLRVYREAVLTRYRDSQVVEGYQRMSARDQRVCPACLLLDDGTVYPLTAPFDEHPQGRCTPVPVVQGVRNPSWETGEAWLTRQPAETQRAVLGPGRWEAWQRGQFALADIVGLRRDATWGNSPYARPLRALTGR